MGTGENTPDIKIWQEGEVFHIDVRGLIPPQPMVAVLSLLESGKVPCCLMVHIDREPVNLYPELEERGWSHETSRVDDGYYQVKVSR